MNSDRDGRQASCTVVICTRNRPEELDRCLAAVTRLDYPKFNVLVVDNDPSNDLARQSAARWGADYLLEPVVGLSRARNTGARASTSEVVAFLDDDAVPEPQWLTALAAEFRDSTVVGVTGRTLPIQPEDASEDALPFTAGMDRGANYRRLDRFAPFWFEIAVFGGFGGGGNLGLRRRVFDTWSGFDERLGRGGLIPGHEDGHAIASLIESGHTVSYAPDAIIHHPGPMTMQEARTEQLAGYCSTTAYALLLLIESRHRWKVLRYIFLGQLGCNRGWRGPSTPLVSRFRVMAAVVSGTVLYAKFCRSYARGTRRGWADRP
jgi:O-antigen biosynthesis protein